MVIFTSYRPNHGYKTAPEQSVSHPSRFAVVKPPIFNRVVQPSQNLRRIKEIEFPYL
jgi:hypothetical protein